MFPKSISFFFYGFQNYEYKPESQVTIYCPKFFQQDVKIFDQSLKSQLGFKVFLAYPNCISPCELDCQCFSLGNNLMFLCSKNLFQNLYESLVLMWSL